MTEKQTKKLWKPKNLADIFFTNGEKYKDKNALTYKEGHRYHKLTYGELRDEIVRAVLVLKGLGIKKGDYVLIASENRPEWVIVDVAIMSIGAVSVPIHKNLAPSQVECVLNETKPVLAFFSDEVALKTIGGGKKKIKYLVSFEKLPKSKILFFGSLMSEVELTDAAVKKVQKEALAIGADTIMTVVYTSGTTGKPKGAQLTHKNILSVILGSPTVRDANFDLCFSILPLSHIYGKVVDNLLVLYTGSEIWYCLDIMNFADEIKTCRPTVITAVPRLFEKIYEQTIQKVSKLPILKKLLEYVLSSESPNSIAVFVCKKLVFDKVYRTLGGRLRTYFSGGAGIDTEIVRFFELTGIPFVDGYGLTETAATVTINDLHRNRLGTVGRPIDGVLIKIVEGEILVRGDSIMVGYLNDDDMRGAFTKDGYFKTGDLGKIDKDGYLTVIGRKKDVQVLSTGENVVPVVVESNLVLSPYIDQCLVVGDGYKHISAIIVPNIGSIKSALGENNIKSIKDAKDDPRVAELLGNEVRRTTSGLPKIQQVNRFIIAHDEFSIENGQMTATLKPRRQEIVKAYAREIKELYGK